MKSASKRKGLKEKLTMPFYRAPKPSMQFGGKVKSPAPPAASLGLLVDDEFVLPSPKLKASTLVKKEGGGDLGRYGDMANGGDSISEVDRRAASYISYVQERFRLEQGTDDQRKYEQVKEGRLK
ncbi:hypothetical protein COCNU_scaffold004463G000060 [Cocos nucifera]|nr:hypothetical protein [Cocos nucifera]